MKPFGENIKTIKKEVVIWEKDIKSFYQAKILGVEDKIWRIFRRNIVGVFSLVKKAKLKDLEEQKAKF